MATKGPSSHEKYQHKRRQPSSPFRDMRAPGPDRIDRYRPGGCVHGISTEGRQGPAGAEERALAIVFSCVDRRESQKYIREQFLRARRPRLSNLFGLKSRSLLVSDLCHLWSGWRSIPALIRCTLRHSYRGTLRLLLKINYHLRISGNI